jgi:hypothetical protein
MQSSQLLNIEVQKSEANKKLFARKLFRVVSSSQTVPNLEQILQQPVFAPQLIHASGAGTCPPQVNATFPLKHSSQGCF